MDLIGHTPNPGQLPYNKVKFHIAHVHVNGVVPTSAKQSAKLFPELLQKATSVTLEYHYECYVWPPYYHVFVS